MCQSNNECKKLDMKVQVEFHMANVEIFVPLIIIIEQNE